MTVCGVVIYSALFLLVPRTATYAGPSSSGTASINFYEVAESPKEGFSAMTGGNGLKGRTLYVGRTPDMTMDDIAGVAALLEKNGPVLRITFTPEGREKFKTLTSTRSAGGKVSREAIAINGDLVSAPSIRQEIDAPSADIDGGGPYWQAEIDAFIRALPSDKRY